MGYQMNNKIINFFKIILIIIYIILEEIIWNLFVVKIRAFVLKFNIVQKSKEIILKQNRYVVLMIFLLPFLIAESIDIISVIALAQGFIVLGVAIYILKIVIASFSFWIFSFAKDILTSFSWFNYSYKLISRAISYLNSTTIYKLTTAKIKEIKHKLKEILSQKSVY